LTVMLYDGLWVEIMSVSKLDRRDVGLWQKGGSPFVIELPFIT
jgi:hypothetical protein